MKLQVLRKDIQKFTYYLIRDLTQRLGLGKEKPIFFTPLAMINLWISLYFKKILNREYNLTTFVEIKSI